MKYLIFSIRILIFSTCFYYSLNIYSLISLVLLLGSIFFLQPSQRALDIRAKIINLEKINLKKLANETNNETGKYLTKLESLCTYDATRGVNCLLNFRKIQINSECLFARNAKLWGAMDYQRHFSLEENIEKWVPTFAKFCFKCQSHRLDGFLFELPSENFDSSVQDLAKVVNRTLKYLTMRERHHNLHPTESLLKSTTNHIDAYNKITNQINANETITNHVQGIEPTVKQIFEAEPSTNRIITKTTINKATLFRKQFDKEWTEIVGMKRWVFTFCEQTFFISTFSPIYPPNHPRHTFGVDAIFVLFQPEISFALHDVPLDLTNRGRHLVFPSSPSDRGDDARMRIRRRFAARGRGEYLAHERMVHSVVLPLDASSGAPVDFSKQ